MMPLSVPDKIKVPLCGASGCCHRSQSRGPVGLNWSRQLWLLLSARTPPQHSIASNDTMPPAPNPELRRQVIAIYKRKSTRRPQTHILALTRSRPPELLFLGRDYPQGYGFFRSRLHKAFMSKADVTNEDEIRQGIAHADYVRKGKRYGSRELARQGHWKNKLTRC